MSYLGTARGNLIELDEPLPFADGERVTVDVQGQPKPERSTGADVLRAVLASPPVSSDDVEELMQIIRAGKKPPGPPVEF
jgi:hypothetical protein